MKQNIERFVDHCQPSFLDKIFCFVKIGSNVLQANICTPGLGEIMAMLEELNLNHDVGFEEFALKLNFTDLGNGYDW